MVGRRSFRLFTVLAFLYGPIVLLIAYSFNESRLVTVWSGFSVRWYGALFQNRQLLSAAVLSLKVVAVSAVAAVALGTCAAFALARPRVRFRGRRWLAVLG